MRLSIRFLLILLPVLTFTTAGIFLFDESIAFAQAAESDDRKAEADRLLQQGTQQYRVSQFREALQSWKAALQIYRQIGDRQGEGAALGNLGNAYADLGQYQRAIELYEQVLVIVREIGDRQGEGAALNNLGIAYADLGQYQRAIQLYEQRLIIAREIGDRQGEGAALNNLGIAYRNLGQYQRAIESYQQALGIAQEIGDRAAGGITLNNIGRLLNLQNQPELAIVFLKQSVNVRESIRGDIRGLDRALQQSYTDTVAGTYRLLADLLLQENRVLEAQRVLDLLKVQELDDYLQNVQRSTQTAAGVDYWRPEQRILELYAQVIREATELAQLDEKKKQGNLTAEEDRRYQELLARRTEIRTSFNQFIGLSDVQAAIAQLRDTTSGQNIEVAQLQSLQTNLRNLNQNAVLLYPLILDDRLELVLVTPDAPPVRKPVEISAANLNRLIVQMGQALKDPTSNIQPIAQQLYQVLIQPIEAELAAANAKTIIYAPDGALRYIPLPALHDGNQWLAERFAVTHITAASLTNFSMQPSYRADQLRILAGACSECEFDFTVAGQPFNFRDLPFARTEVENIAAEIPGTETLIDQNFSPDRLLQTVRQFPIVHLATHAAFVQGEQSDESFIVFGNNSKLRLADILPQWELTETDLVVLSACETAIGEAQPGSGIEILGFGYQMQLAGAKAAIASLWQVNDGGTQVLMNAFYTALESGKTKAQALQLAQQTLISGNLTVAEQTGRNATIGARDIRTGLPPEVSSRLSHPYYWAPFILIGNGL
ncbi:CHAT domain-containing protein [Leptolyngbya ohadii]|uniref:CHAT domain-containing protein n=1 Tax=Leptolyngbya ohadii TaxID=1962290 RepID=UPI000B5A164E|nr:CHAT domain-containing protein [Leptolyngbya ohadii]